MFTCDFTDADFTSQLIRSVLGSAFVGCAEGEAGVEGCKLASGITPIMQCETSQGLPSSERAPFLPVWHLFSPCMAIARTQQLLARARHLTDLGQMGMSSRVWPRDTQALLLSSSQLVATKPLSGWQTSLQHNLHHAPPLSLGKMEKDTRV